jgi:hypothetical protein
MARIEVQYNVQIGDDNELEAGLYKALDAIADGDTVEFRHALRRWRDKVIEYMDAKAEEPETYAETWGARVDAAYDDGLDRLMDAAVEARR